MKTLSITSRLAVRLTILAMVASSCDKDVGKTNPTASVQGSTEAGSGNGDANANDLEALKKRLEDQKSQFDAILSETARRLDAKNAEQDARLVAIEAKLAALEADLNAKIKALEGKVDAGFAVLKLQLEDLIGKVSVLRKDVDLLRADVNGILEDIKATIADRKASLVKEKDDYALEITALEAATPVDTVRVNLLKASVLLVDEDIKNLPDAAGTTPTKFGIRYSLQATKNQLDRKMALLRNAIATAQAADKAQLQAKIDAVAADLAKVDTRLKTAEATLATAIQDIKDLKAADVAFGIKLAEAVKKIEDGLTLLAGQITTQINLAKAELRLDIKAGDDALKVMIAQLRLDSEKAQKELKDQLNSLRADQVQQRLDLMKQINDLAALELVHKAAIEASIATLTEEVRRVANLAQAAKELADLNATKLTTLQADFDKFKVDFQAKLDELRTSLTNRLNDLQTKVTAVTNDVTLMKPQLLDITARLAQAEARIQGLNDAIAFLFVKIVTNAGQIASMQALLAPYSKNLNVEIQSVIQFANAVEADVIDAGIGPVMTGVPGVDVEGLNIDFVTSVGGICANHGLFPTGKDQFGNFQLATIMGFEWFYQFGRIYVQDLVLAARGNPAVDPVFFGKVSPIVDTGLNSKLVSGLLASYSIKASANCDKAVTAWVRKILYGASAQSIAIRTGIKNSAQVAQHVGQLFNALGRLNTQSNEFMKTLVAFLIPFVGSDAAVVKMLTELPNGNPSILAQLALILLDKANETNIELLLARDRDAISDLAMDIKKQKLANETNATKIAAINVEIADLKTAIANMNTAITELSKQQKQLLASEIVTLNLVATIAARLGYDDLIKIARDEIEKLGGVYAPYVGVNSVFSVNHFYMHANDYTGLNTKRCDSMISKSGSPVLDRLGLTVCAVHSTGVNGIAYTIGNSIPAPTGNGWSLYGVRDPKSGLLIQNGLGLLWSAANPNSFSPTDPSNILLMNRQQGVKPVDGLPLSSSVFALQVVGGAGFEKGGTFDISVESDLPATADTAADVYNVSVVADQFNVGINPADPTSSSYIYRIPLPKAVTKLAAGYCTWNKKIKVSSRSKSGVVGAQSVVHKLHMFSPIVLEMSGASMVSTIDPAHSQVKFDLDANGILDNTGWVGGKTGFLAIDRNGNGRIDDGSELFGQATDVVAQPGKKAENGYTAMAQFDSNHDGLLSAQDKIWGKLVVWFDANADGKSQGIEMKTLEQVGITKIEVNYEDVPKQQVVQSKSKLESNLVKYTAKFYGPAQCGEKGCNSYDVFFGSSQSIVVGANK